MMERIGLVARREFVTTVGRKGFLIGVFLMPVLMIGLIMLVPRILGSRAPAVVAEVAVQDQAGGLVSALRRELDPQQIAARRVAAIRQAQAAAPAAAVGAAASAARSGPPLPHFTVTDRNDMTLAEARSWVAAPAQGDERRALVVIKADAVRPPPGGRFGTYDLYVSSGLDENTENILHESLRLTLVAARFSATGLDPEAIEATMRVIRPGAVIVGTKGEKPAQRGFNRLLPFAMGILLFIGVLMGGQTLMTSTIEEKSNRVVEVLLAAVSPLELMWGKLIGQLGVGLVVLAIYIGMCVLGLFQFALFGLLDPMLIVWLFAFFLVTYLVFGALMLAIGAAVNQIADAQSLLGPVMLLLIAPYMLAPIIGQAPNSFFSVAVSFIPPINTFAMMARLASVTPPPVWQVLLSLLIGIAAAAGAVWFAAKVFRIGLLMHGKPPNLATLIRWARQA
jgi:ABC-2 type transport system permease protein